MKCDHDQGIRRMVAGGWFATLLLAMAAKVSAAPGIPVWRVELGDGVKPVGAPAVGAEDRMGVATVRVGADGAVDRAQLVGIAPDGTAAWAQTLSTPVLGSPVVIGGGSDVLVVTGAGEVRRHSLVNGELRWRVDYAAQGITFLTPPLVRADGEVVLAGKDLNNNTVLAGLGDDGAEHWRNDAAFRQATGNFFDPGLGDADGMIAGDGWTFLRGGSVFALLPSNQFADLALSHGATNIFGGVPLLGLGHLVADSSGLQARESDQRIRWSHDDWIPGAAPVVSAAGTIYFGDESGRFRAVTPGGDVAWSFEAKSPLRTTAALAADGTVYFGTAGGTMFALNAGGDVAWQSDLAGAVAGSPTVLASGAVVVGTERGTVWALAGGAPLATGGWPKRHGDLANTGRSVDVPRLPAAVTGVEAVDRLAVELSWNPVSGARGYEVFRSTTEVRGEGPYTGAERLDVTRYLDRAVTNAVEYRYWVRATNTVGAGEFSAVATITARKDLWRQRMAGGTTIVGGPVLTGSGLVVVAGATSQPRGGFVVGFRPDGSQAWYTTVTQAVSAGPLVRRNGTLVVAGTDRGWVLEESGAVKQAFPVGNVSGGNLAMGPDGSVYQFSLVPSPRLNLAWPEAAALAPLALPLTGAVPNLAVLADGGFVIVEPGRVRWMNAYGTRERLSVRMPAAVALLSGGDSLVVSAGSVSRYAPEGTARWTKPWTVGQVASGILAVDRDDRVYGATTKKEAFALSAEGELAWVAEAEPRLTAGTPLLDAQGNVWHPGSWLVGHDRDGKLVDTLALGSQGPTAGLAWGADGQLYYVTASGVLRAVRMSAGHAVDAVWSSKQRDPQGTASRVLETTEVPPPPSLEVIPWVGRNRLRWEPPERAQFLAVYRSSTPGATNAAFLGLVEAGSGRWDDPPTTAGVTNYYQLATVNAAGQGPLSAAVSGVSTEVRVRGSVTNISRTWRVNLPPATAPDGTVVLALAEGGFNGYAAEGKRQWSLSAGCCSAQVSFPPLVTREGNVFLGSSESLLRARLDGTEAFFWPHPSFGRPYLRDDGLVCQPTQGSHECFDGTRREVALVSGGVDVVPPFGAGGMRGFLGQYELAVGGWEWRLGLRNAYDQSVVWALPSTRGLNDVLPLSLGAIGADGALYTYLLGEGLKCVHADGSVRWRTASTSDPAQWKTAVPVLASDGTVFAPLWVTNLPSLAVPQGDILHALSPVDGSVRWRFLREPLSGVPAVVADGTVLAPCGTNVYALDASTGAIRWAYEAPYRVYQVQVTTNGLIVLNTDRALVMLQGLAGPAASTWPMALHDARNTGMVGADGAVELIAESVAAAGEAEADGAGRRVRLTARDGKTPFLPMHSTDMLRWEFPEEAWLEAGKAAQGAVTWDIELEPGSGARFFFGARP